MHSSTLFTSLLATTFFATTVLATWDLTKQNNLVVYWGQNAHGAYSPDDDKQQTDLVNYCANTNIDLVVLSFLSNYNSTGGEPVVNFANSCTGFETFPGTDLLWCPSIAADIQTCQTTYKKKILMSLGGGAGAYHLSSDTTTAAAFADTVWNMFGKGWTYYRPFGNAIVDGFDLDIETDATTANYAAFATRLRTLMATDTSKTYYLTAAPQCPNPDPHLNSAMTTVSFDAIFIQFYNNAACQADQYVAGADESTNSGFNYGMWDTWAKASSKNKSVKLFLGLLASGHVGTGYVSAATGATMITNLKGKYTSFGGAMLWDASEAAANTALIPTLRTALGTTASRMVRRGAGWWWQI